MRLQNLWGRGVSRACTHKTWQSSALAVSQAGGALVASGVQAETQLASEGPQVGRRPSFYAAVLNHPLPHHSSAPGAPVLMSEVCGDPRAPAECLARTLSPFMLGSLRGTCELGPKSMCLGPLAVYIQATPPA